MKVMLIDTPEDPVRLAFAHLFDKRPGMQNDDGTKSPDKFELTPILKRGGENEAKVRAAITSVASEKWGTDKVDVYNDDGEKTGQLPAWEAEYKSFADDQKGLRNGNLKRNDAGDIYPGFEGAVYVVARNTNRPGVFSRQAETLVKVGSEIKKLGKDAGGKDEVQDFDGTAPYAGGYGNVEIDIWALAKKGVKKRVCVDLLGVQHTRDGDAFGSGAAPSKASSFANLSAADETGASGSAFD